MYKNAGSGINYNSIKWGKPKCLSIVEQIKYGIHTVEF